MCPKICRVHNSKGISNSTFSRLILQILNNPQHRSRKCQKTDPACNHEIYLNDLLKWDIPASKDQHHPHQRIKVSRCI